VKYLVGFIEKGKKILQQAAGKLRSKALAGPAEQDRKIH